MGCVFVVTHGKCREDSRTVFAVSRHAVCRALCLVMHKHGWLMHVGTTACMRFVKAPAGACCRVDPGAGSLALFEAVLTELFPISAQHAALVCIDVSTWVYKRYALERGRFCAGACRHLRNCWSMVPCTISRSARRKVCVDAL